MAGPTDSPKASTSALTLRSAYLRMEDGKPALVILRENGTGEVFQLRPAQIVSIAVEATHLIWGYFDLVERK